MQEFSEDTTWLWQKATSWTVVLAAAGIFWLFAGIMASDHRYLGAGIAYSVGVVCLFLKYLHWVYTERPKGKRKFLIVVGSIAFLLLEAIGCGIFYYLSLHRMESPQPQTPAPVPISFRLGCEWTHIPIHIPAASTIHVLRLHPAVLYGNPHIPDLGVFENVSSPSDKPMDWPNKRNGRWMTKEERDKVWSFGIMATPFASKCTLASYSPQVTLDEIIAYLFIDISDTAKPARPKPATPALKHLSFPIAFDPLMSGRSFQFYIVNTCSSGDIPELVQWGDSAIVRVAGEQSPRRVPLRFERLNFPSQLLMGSMGASSFIWNDLHDCQWKNPQ